MFYILVRSFGTEDRDVSQKVPPQNNVYDYILFRGTDIRDIVVINNAPTYPNDPAIMQLTLQPKPYGTQTFAQTMMGPPPPPHLGHFSAAGYSTGVMMGGVPAAPGLGAVGRPTEQQTAARNFPKPSELTMSGEIPVVPPAAHQYHHLSPAATATTTVVESATSDGHGNFLETRRDKASCKLLCSFAIIK